MCKFCDIINGKTKKDILFGDSCVLVFLGRPHHLGHTEVVLREHQEDLTSLPEEKVHAFIDDMVAVARVLQKVLKPDKLNYELFGNWSPSNGIFCPALGLIQISETLQEICTKNSRHFCVKKDLVSVWPVSRLTK